MKIVEDNYNVACDILEKPGYEQARAEWETEQAADKAIWAKEWDTYTQSLANKEEHTPADQTQAWSRANSFAQGMGRLWGGTNGAMGKIWIVKLCKAL